MTYTFSNKCAKNLCKRTVLLQLIIKNVVTFFWNTVYIQVFLCIQNFPQGQICSKNYHFYDFGGGALRPHFKADNGEIQLEGMDLELPHSCQIWKESLKRFDLKGKFIPPLAEAVTNCIRKTKKKRSLESEYRYLSHDYRNSVKYCFPQHFTEIRQSGNWRC